MIREYRQITWELVCRVDTSNFTQHSASTTKTEELHATTEDHCLNDRCPSEDNVLLRQVFVDHRQAYREKYVLN